MQLQKDVNSCHCDTTRRVRMPSELGSRAYLHHWPFAQRHSMIDVDRDGLHKCRLAHAGSIRDPDDDGCRLESLGRTLFILLTAHRQSERSGGQKRGSRKQCDLSLAMLTRVRGWGDKSKGSMQSLAGSVCWEAAPGTLGSFS